MALATTRAGVDWSEEGVVLMPDGSARVPFQMYSYAVRLVDGERCVVAVLPSGAKGIDAYTEDEYIDGKLLPAMREALADSPSDYAVLDAPSL